MMIEKVMTQLGPKKIKNKKQQGVGVRSSLSRPDCPITPLHFLAQFKPTKTTHFQPSNSITQPTQHQKNILSYPSSFLYPISTSPLRSFNNNNQNYIPPQQIPPEKSKLHINKFSLSTSNPQNLNISPLVQLDSFTHFQQIRTV